MAKKILIISDEFPPEGGGAGVVCRRLVLDLVMLGHDVTLVTGGCDNDPLSQVRHYQVKRRTLVWVFSYWKVLKSISLSSFDIIVLNDFVSVYLAGLFFSNQILKKCTLIVHGDDATFVFKRSTKKHIVFGYKRRYGRAVNGCKNVVAVSEYAKNIYVNNIPPSLKMKSIEFEYAGIDSSDFDMTKSLSKEKLDIPDDGKIIFTACRLVEEKGIFVQLSLFSELCEKHKNIYWVVAGDGVDRGRFVDEIKNLNLQGRVILLGKVHRSDIGMYYKLANVFWMISERETMGLVYIEASLFGVPSIGYERHGVKEAISPGRSGFFYDPSTFESDLEYCLEHDMSQMCREHANKFKTINFAKYVAGKA